MISQQGIDFIKRHEGFSSLPYLCAAGKETIGYGHVIKQGEQFPRGLTEKQAEDILYDDLAEAEQCIFDNVIVDLLPNQFDALVSLIFNIGTKAFEKSTLLRMLNSEQFEEAGKQFLRWIYANGKVVYGLQKRRENEYKLFEGGKYGNS